MDKADRILAASSRALAPYRGLTISPPVLPRITFPGLGLVSFMRLTVPVVKVPAVAALLPRIVTDPDFMKATRALQESLAAVGRITEPMRRFSAFMAEAGRRQRLLEASGWLPHYTTPFEVFDETDDPVEIASRIEGHYTDHWTEIRASFEAHLANYAIDDQAKAVFVQALQLHEAGFYRAVSPLLFPEVERIARMQLHDGKLSGFASQHRLRELAGELCLDETLPGGMHSLHLYQRLDEHLYANVNTTEQLEAARKDSVPNRHAVLHGLVAYETRQASLNGLIMVDFVLQVFSALKADVAIAAAA